MELEIAENKSLKITWGALIALCAGVIGFTVWMTLMQFQNTANAQAVAAMTLEQTGIQKALQSIDKRLSRIEIMMEQQMASSHKRGD